MEIERKFLVNPNLYSLYNKEYQKVNIKQYYLSINPELRMRKQDDKVYLCFKSNGTLVRKEKEFLVPSYFYDRYISLKKTNEIKKTRYIYQLNNLFLEVDIYKDNLDPLITAEIEFNSKEEAMKFDKSSVCFLDKEITNDLNYKNKNLSKINNLKDLI